MEEFKSIVLFAATTGAIVAVVVQKIKETITLKNAQWYSIISLVLNLTLGVLIAHRFGGFTWEASCWVGGVAWVGADLIYKVLNATNVMASASELTDGATDTEVKDDESAEG